MTGAVRARVSCPRCGTVDVMLADLSLSASHSGDPAHYEFHCPSCDSRVTRPADARIRRVLTRNDVALNTGLVEELRLAGFETDATDVPDE